MKLGNFIALLFLLVNTALLAGGDHDHGHDHGTEQVALPANPRASMESKQFDLVVIANDQHLTLYLDDFTTNAPIADADIELELGDLTLTATAKASGEYDITLEQPLADGIHPLMITVVTADGADLLTGELDIHTQATEEITADDPLADIFKQPILLMAIAVAVFCLLLALFVTLRRDRQQEQIA